MKTGISRRFWAVACVAVLGLSGCYTVLNHPTVAPEQQVDDTGNVIGSNDCSSCHTLSEVWEFHHNPYYNGVPSHSSSGSWVWDYYVSRYDPYFLRWKYYKRPHYNRWLSYYHSPWWYWNPGSGGTRPATAQNEPAATGRGAQRDTYDQVYPRYGGSFTTTTPSASVSVPTGSGSSGTNARQATDTDNTQSNERAVTTQRRGSNSSSSSSAVRSSSSSSRGTRGRGASGAQRSARSNQSSSSEDDENQEEETSDNSRGSSSRSR